MGQKIQLKAGDGFTLDAYTASPSGKAKGGIVLIQEIFGEAARDRSNLKRKSQKKKKPDGL